VEDLALEDLKDAINQVVLLQNVRGTLMDEIAQLKRRLSTQTDELNQVRTSAEVCVGPASPMCRGGPVLPSVARLTPPLISGITQLFRSRT